MSTLTNIVRVEQSGGIAVFNFTVEGNHNYFILAKDFNYGQTCVLVHNAKCGPDTVDQRALRELIDEVTNGGRKPLTPDDANTLLDWAAEVGLPYRASVDDLASPINHWIEGPHIHFDGDHYRVSSPNLVKPR